jgi:LIM homeobox protein 1
LFVKKRSDKEKLAKKNRGKLNSYGNSTKICFVVLSISQVWFQNKRSKERRLKQLTSMGRGPFFGGSRKMRGFPMNLSPGGLDEPGFPYFGSDKFDFGYGGPPFHPHDSPFFPGHPGMPFNGPG